GGGARRYQRGAGGRARPAPAQNGRRGPTVLALPEDMLVETVAAPPLGPAPVARAPPRPEDLDARGDRLNAAGRAVVLAGGGGWTAAGAQALRRFVDKAGLPAGLSFRSKDLLDNRHPLYAGDVGIAPNPALAARIRDCDLLIALGPRLGEMTTSGYTLLTPDHAARALVHIHPGAEELGRVYTPALAIAASPVETALALAERDWPANAARRAAAEAAHADYEAFSTPVRVEEGVNLSEVFAWLDAALPDDAVICNGAGNYAAWLHRFYRHNGFKTQLAPTSGAMGYGFPAAIAAKATYPDRTVVCAAGDGCFMMASSELATAVQYDLPVITIVADNGTYGTIRMHQERSYPGRVSGTDLVNPDFAAFAESFGAFGVQVRETAAFPAAFEAARASGKPAVIHVLTSAREIAPGVRL
ncbi:MAG: thiamine pyrophosphate-dependent enzyme, partial [Pseudomonadota bacterium]